MIIVIDIKEQYFATLSTPETCPYCKHQQVVMDFGQLYADVLFGLCMPSRKTGKTRCVHCNCEIPKKQWTPSLKAFFNQHKREYKLSKWKRYSWGIFISTVISVLLVGVGYLVAGSFISTSPGPRNKEAANQEDLLNHLDHNQIVSAYLNPVNPLGLPGQMYFYIANIHGDTIRCNPFKGPVQLGKMKEYYPGPGFDYTRDIGISYKHLKERKEIQLYYDSSQPGKQWTKAEQTIGTFHWVVR